MPVERCQTMGRRGYRWGKRGVCYTGAGARAKAERQGKAIEAGGYEKPLNDSDFKPPADVRREARLGLKLREEFGRGGLSSREAGEQGIGSGIVRAQNIEQGAQLSKRTIRRMVAFFGRFARFEREKGGSEERGFWADEENPSRAWIAWLLWGGTAGRDWAEGLLARMERADRGEE
jgi:hypothetical protein